MTEENKPVPVPDSGSHVPQRPSTPEPKPVNKGGYIGESQADLDILRKAAEIPPRPPKDSNDKK